MKKYALIFGSISAAWIVWSFINSEVSDSEKNIKVVATEQSSIVSKNDRLSEIASKQIAPTQQTEKDELDSTVLKMAASLTDHLAKALAEGGLIDRNAILKEAIKDPLSFTEAVGYLLEELPYEQVETRVMCLSLLADTIHISRGEGLLNSQTDDKVFDRIYDIADKSLRANELVDSDIFQNLSDYQKETFLHDGSIIEENGKIFRSTLPEKTMVLALAKMDLNSNRSEQYSSQVPNKINIADQDWLVGVDKQLSHLNKTR